MRLAGVGRKGFLNRKSRCFVSPCKRSDLGLLAGLGIVPGKEGLLSHGAIDPFPNRRLGPPQHGMTAPVCPASSRAQVGLRRTHGRPWRGLNRVRSFCPRHRREGRCPFPRHSLQFKYGSQRSTWPRISPTLASPVPPIRPVTALAAPRRGISEHPPAAPKTEERRVGRVLNYLRTLIAAGLEQKERLLKERAQTRALAVS